MSQPHLEIVKSISTQVCHAIIDHRLPLGAIISEPEMSQVFGVDRKIINLAMINLAEKNFIERKPHFGSVVIGPSQEDTHAVFNARRIIEREIVYRVSKNITSKQIDILKNKLEEEKVALREGDRSLHIRLSGDLHVLLAKINGNSVLTNYLMDLTLRTAVIISLYGLRRQVASTDHDDHQKLIKLIETSESELSVVEITEHLNEIEKGLHFGGKNKKVCLHNIFK